MLRDLQKLVDSNELSGLTEESFEETASILRQHQFVWRDKRGHSKHYDILVKYQDYYSNLFGAFGDLFFVDHHFGYCGIIPRSNTPVLKLRETLFLLLLARLHDGECRKACTENGRSSPSEDILLDQYVELTGKDKPKLSETKESLDRLVRYGVIELGSLNPDTELRKITILPSIMRVVNTSFIKDLEAFSVKDTDVEHEPQTEQDTSNE
jgi:hypothetical protein